MKIVIIDNYDSFQFETVVSEHGNICSELLYQVRQIVREAVVIIYYYYFHFFL